MKRCIEFINYKWKAKGRHGIHSPFVYDLVDHCFHISLKKKIQGKINGTQKRNKKSLRLLLQLVQHHEVCEMACNLHNFIDLEELLSDQELKCAVLPLSTLGIHALQNVSLVYFSMDNTNATHCADLQTFVMELNEQTLFVVDGIRKTVEIEKNWKKIISDDSIHFTVDMYTFGLLSKRPQQVKEHFVLRY